MSVCPPVWQSVRNAEVLWSLRLEYFDKRGALGLLRSADCSPGRQFISRLIYLISQESSLSINPNITELLERKRPQILAGIWVGYGKSGSRRRKPAISLKRLDGKLYWFVTNRYHYRVFIHTCLSPSEAWYMSSHDCGMTDTKRHCYSVLQWGVARIWPRFPGNRARQAAVRWLVLSIQCFYNNNNNNTNVNLYGAVVARVHPVHAMNAGQRNETKQLPAHSLCRSKFTATSRSFPGTARLFHVATWSSERFGDSAPRRQTVNHGRKLF